MRAVGGLVGPAGGRLTGSRRGVPEGSDTDLTDEKGAPMTVLTDAIDLLMSDH